MLLFHYQLFLSSFGINVNTGLLKKYRDTRIERGKKRYFMRWVDWSLITQPEDVSMILVKYELFQNTKPCDQQILLEMRT